MPRSHNLSLQELTFECRSVRFQTMLFISIHFSSEIISWTLGDRFKPYRRMHLSWREHLPPCAVNPFPPSCAEFGKRGSQTKVVHVTVTNESTLQIMAFSPLLLSVIMSNLYISHRSCRLIYPGVGVGK